MKAIIYTARGAANETLVLVDKPVPEPGPGEVLVRVHASGVNPSDVKIRSGAQGPMVADEVIPHNDGAGVIEAVGEGVSRRRIGGSVWLYNASTARLMEALRVRVERRWTMLQFLRISPRPCPMAYLSLRVLA